MQTLFVEISVDREDKRDDTRITAIEIQSDSVKWEEIYPQVHLNIESTWCDLVDINGTPNIIGYEIVTLRSGDSEIVKNSIVIKEQTGTVCPSCGEDVMDPVIHRNALSRTDSKTFICNQCGTNEALTAMLFQI